MLGIIPPDPGVSHGAAVVRDPSRAVALAKASTHDKLTGGFRRGNELRWLRRDGDRLVSSASHELRVDADTHLILTRARDLLEEGAFTSEVGSSRELYVLEEDGFEARAVPA